MRNIKILIVEDELLIAENLSIKLKKLNYEIVDIVSSGKAAIAKAKLHKPDLILMDIAIKGELDGIKTAEKIKESQNIAIIFLTAYADDLTVERASLTGCYGYILKPFKDKELQATIKIALKKHQEQTNIQKTLTEVTKLLGEYSAEKNHIYEDELTGLPNQLMLRELFTFLLVDNDEYSESYDELNNKVCLSKKLLSVIYIKLYKFERILGSLGNQQNGMLMKAIGERLAEMTNNSGYSGVTIKLQSSDFTILLSGLDRRQIASNFAESILAQLNEPFFINNKKIFVTASIGISFYPFDNVSIERLLEQAEQAMNYAEKQGSNKYQLYTSAFRIMNSNVAVDLSLEADLHQAIDHNELELYYQPKVDLKTGKIISAEALLRWNHPKLGVIAPNKIFPLAEITGLMNKIDQWVLTTGCNQLKKWHESSLNFLTVAINLSGYQFKQADLFHQLTRLIFELNINPKFLDLELTEQTLVANSQANIQKLKMIKNLGVSISLDDFGTGYSSLGYLNQFPFDYLKVDRSFITKIDRNFQNSVIVKSIIEMAHKLNLKVVAEGIETKAELDFLLANQCDEIQGYFISRPLPIQDFEKLVKDNNTFLALPNEEFIAH